MSILDRAGLITQGDTLPGRWEKHHKDGVEEKWTTREAAAIRGLSAGYSPKVVAKKIGCKPRTVEGWMGNPYFMTEVQKLLNHNLFQYRAGVIRTTALRAIEGSAQHARLFLKITGDLNEERASGDGEFDNVSDQKLDDDLKRAIDLMTG